ncbi:MAG: tRNA-dihydrouridine synthase, partial [bacterium]
KAVQILANKAQGFDINFGCPVPKVIKQTAGCELFKNLKLSKEVIKQTIANTNLPVSIKIRSQAGQINCLEFLDNVSDLDIKAIMIHGRSFKQGFVGPVDYEIIKKARNHFKGIILANGGVDSIESAKLMLEKTGADGIGIAQGAMGRPWLFEEIKYGKHDKSRDEIFKIMLEHAKLAQKYSKQSGISFNEIRKHLGWYVSGFPQAKIMRKALVQSNSLKEIKLILKQYKQP